MFNSDKDSSIDARRPKQESTAGKSHAKVDARAQCGGFRTREVDAVDLPFPNKPVIHRRTPKMQVKLDLHDFEEMSLSTKQRGHLMPQQYNFSDIGNTTGSLNSKKDLHRLPTEHHQITGTIHAKELMLQEKLWRVGEKIRQTIHSESAGIAAEDKHKTGEDMLCRGRTERRDAPTTAQITKHQRREPARGRDMSEEESLSDDFKQPKNKQYQRTEDGVKNKHAIQYARWGVHRNEMTVVQNKLSLQNADKVKRDENNSGDWEAIDEYSKDNKVPLGDKGWTSEKKYRERLHENSLHEQQNMPQMSVQKSAHRPAAKDQRGAGRNHSGESSLPLVSSSSRCSQQEQAEPVVMNTTDDSHQLLPCKFCNRTFKMERRDKHMQICSKTNASKREVFNSFLNRTKGSNLEHFLKTHTRSKTQEVSLFNA